MKSSKSIPQYNGTKLSNAFFWPRSRSWHLDWNVVARELVCFTLTYWFFDFPRSSTKRKGDKFPQSRLRRHPPDEHTYFFMVVLIIKVWTVRWPLTHDKMYRNVHDIKTENGAKILRFPLRTLKPHFDLAKEKEKSVLFVNLLTGWLFISTTKGSQHPFHSVCQLESKWRKENMG